MISTALSNSVTDNIDVNGISSTIGIINHVSGGMVMREWEDSISLNNVDPDLPEPTIKNGFVL
jgi:hypothetical protein